MIKGAKMAKMVGFLEQKQNPKWLGFWNKGT